MITTPKSSNNMNEKEGILRKRSGRMQRWASRYFVLSNDGKLVYKLKQDSTQLRGGFELCPGCIVTEVAEDSVTTMKGLSKRIFSFWIVWPHDKNQKTPTANETDKRAVPADDSDDEEIIGNKDLKQIVATEMKTQKLQQKFVEQEVQNHKAHDQNIKLGYTIAAVAVGGAVIGALTAGIGLIPYITVVGITAAAGTSLR